MKNENILNRVDVHVVDSLDRAVIFCPPRMEKWALFEATTTVPNERMTAESFIRIASATVTK